MPTDRAPVRSYSSLVLPVATHNHLVDVPGAQLVFIRSSVRRFFHTVTLSYILTTPLQNSVFNETLRHFPPTVEIPKFSADDTVFTLTNAAGEKRSLAVPRGTYVSICPSGLHNNRKLNLMRRAYSHWR